MYTVTIPLFWVATSVSLLFQADSQCFVSGFMVLTIFALFAPDLDLLLGTVQSQHALSCEIELTGPLGNFRIQNDTTS